MVESKVNPKPTHGRNSEPNPEQQNVVVTAADKVANGCLKKACNCKQYNRVWLPALANSSTSKKLSLGKFQAMNTRKAAQRYHSLAFW